MSVQRAATATRAQAFVEVVISGREVSFSS
jgi:hypothetical protein